MKIGVIDSGKGGEYIGSLLKKNFNVEVVRWLPFFFRSYSDMNMDELINQAEQHMGWLEDNQVDAVVIGCMTMSTNLTKFIRKRLIYLDVYDLHEFLPEFDEDTLVIGTTNTINSHKFDKYHTLATPGLSSAIENGYIKLVPGLLRGYESGMKAYPNFNKVVLGCSHYSTVRNIFADYYKLEIIDPVDYLLRGLNEKINVHHQYAIA